MAGLEAAEDATTARLRAVEREIGVLEEVLGIRAIPRRGGQADAGPDVQQVPLDDIRAADEVYQAPGQFLGHALAPDVANEHGELVAAQPRHRVLGADGRLQSLADLAEQGVPDGVTQRVIDLLEPVEVDNQEREGGPLPGEGPEGIGEPEVEEGAVGQPRQRIPPAVRVAGCGCRLVDGDRPRLVVHRADRHDDTDPAHDDGGFHGRASGQGAREATDEIGATLNATQCQPQQPAGAQPLDDRRGRKVQQASGRGRAERDTALTIEQHDALRTLVEIPRREIGPGRSCHPLHRQQRADRRCTCCQESHACGSRPPEYRAALPRCLCEAPEFQFNGSRTMMPYRSVKPCFGHFAAAAGSV